MLYQMKSRGRAGHNQTLFSSFHVGYSGMLKLPVFIGGHTNTLHTTNIAPKYKQFEKY